METWRALLALLCVLLAGAQQELERNNRAGKFAENNLQESFMVCLWSYVAHNRSEVMFAARRCVARCCSLE